MEKTIMKFNGIDIMTVEKDGETYVPVKPICDAIGVDYKGQFDKLKEDEFFLPTMGLIPTVAADGKEREMVCLPIRYVYGWLATINPGKVAPEVREKVTRYRLDCYNLLYDHFTGSMRRTIETNKAEIELLQSINAAISDEKAARSRRKKGEEALAKLRAERLNPQPSLF